ncbi:MULTISPECIES: hypothetical protein [unclassified Tolypothrix]|nr:MULTISPECIES: hypothetical protein [unclassified Tolypothrix]EKF06010.1 hypothetical protein FDUTEX481_00362 [Tolypothrix sp. PCC 7601]
MSTSPISATLKQSDRNDLLQAMSTTSRFTSTPPLKKSYHF